MHNAPLVFQLYSKISVLSIKKEKKNPEKNSPEAQPFHVGKLCYWFRSSCQENNAEKKTSMFQTMFGNNSEEKNAYLPVLWAPQVRQQLQ